MGRLNWVVTASWRNRQGWTEATTTPACGAGATAAGAGGTVTAPLSSPIAQHGRAMGAEDAGGQHAMPCGASAMHTAPSGAMNASSSERTTDFMQTTVRL